ncbi:hypothetical protein [Bacteroides heparinolyticus]|uniref:hypothetical protein n=1 Tax=Prevotella heparinolytica TaxID=28113 RepID=UPI0035A08A34
MTPQMRKMAWAKVYSIAGVFGKEKLPKDLSEDARKWRNLALTKKKRLNIKAHMPKRQFMRENRQLEDMIKAEIEKSLKRIQNGITSAQLN